MSVEGEVVATHSRWTSDGSRIVTEATVRTLDGDIVVSQLGGTVDGLTMRTFPGPEILAPGMRVAVAAHRALDGSRREHVVVDGVRVLWMPPEYVRTGPTKAGNYLYWESGCIYVLPDVEGTKEIPGDVELELVDRAIATWNTAVAGCSFMNIVRESPKATEVGRDNVNAIKFRDVSWCRPEIADDPARCYSPSAAGLTTAVYVDDESSSRDGAIVDADIELNGVDFAISHEGDTLGTASCNADLLNTLTHELGHLLGLEHPCRASADPPRVDGQGNAVPSCQSNQLGPEITEATMYNFQECGETKKASLSPDDIAAVCAVYPIADDPGTCERVGDETGCCTSSRGTGSPFGAFVLAGSALLFLTRRGRAKTSQSN